MTNRTVDLTLTMRRGMRGIDWKDAKTLERDGWNARDLHLYSHSGTHMDAPTHFGCGEQTIDEIPLEDCISTARVVDLTGIAPRALIEVADLGDAGTQWTRGESLLLHTGWSRHAEDGDYYRSHFPRISEGLAGWCVDQGVCVLGVEAPSVADVFNLEEVTRIHRIHRILLEGGVVIVESLAHLDRLDRLERDRVTLIALPLKIEGGDGAPCRAIAIEGETKTLSEPPVR